jgi:glycogen synthase
MRVAFVSPEFITEESTFDGGLANYLARAALGLRKFGHEVVVFVPSDAGRPFHWQGVKVERTRIRSVGFRQFARRLLWAAGAPNSAFWLNASHGLNDALRRGHRQSSFDVVQYASYGATAFYRVPEIPAVVRLSSYEPLRRRALKTCPTREAMVYERLEKKALMRGDRIFGPSKLTADAVHSDIKRAVDVVPTPFFFEHTDVDASLFEQHLRGKKYLLFFGSLWKLKGVDVILEILGEVLSANPGYYFVFVGKDLGAGSRLKAVQERSDGRVYYFNSMPHARLYPIIKEAVAVVLPSLYDNCPNACMEAMACRRIVIGSREAGFDELIEPGKTGFLARQGDAKDLLRIINHVLRLPREACTAIGDAAHTKIIGFGPERAIPQLVAFYTSVVAGKPLKAC